MEDKLIAKYNELTNRYRNLIGHIHLWSLTEINNSRLPDFEPSADFISAIAEAVELSNKITILHELLPENSPEKSMQIIDW